MSDFIEREPVAIFVEECGCSSKWIAKRIRNQEAFPAADVAPVRHGRWIPSDYIGDCCYTCSECGFERDVYLLDVGDYCPACGARMDKEDNMNKPLSEWTLGEVKAECEKHTAHCVGCPLWTDAAGCRLDTSCYRDNDPKIWDLSEPPRWTEQDKEDAKAIKRIFPDATYLKRQDCFCEDVTVFSKSHSGVAHLNANLVPSLSMDELVTIDEIIGGGK